MVTNDLSKTRVKKMQSKLSANSAWWLEKSIRYREHRNRQEPIERKKERMMRSAHNDEESAEARVLQCLFADRETGERWKFRDSQDRANSWPIELNRRKVIHPHVYFTHVSTRKWTSEWHFSRQEKSTSSLLGNATSDRTRKDEWNGRVYTLVRHGSLLMEEKSNEIFWTRRNEKKKKKKM